MGGRRFDVVFADVYGVKRTLHIAYRCLVVLVPGQDAIVFQKHTVVRRLCDRESDADADTSPQVSRCDISYNFPLK